MRTRLKTGKRIDDCPVDRFASSYCRLRNRIVRFGGQPNRHRQTHFREDHNDRARRKSCPRSKRPL